MNLGRSRFFKITVLVTALSLSIPMFAASEVAKQTGSGQSVQWQVKVTGQERAVLTVKGPDGSLYVKSFGPGQDPSFSTADLGGAPEDGDYNYELRIEQKVSDNVKGKLAAARANNDDAAIKKIQKEAGLTDLRLSGNLKIVNGSFVSNEGIESGANAGASRTITTDASVASNAVRPGRIEALDQVIPDDLIVQGSICSGFDCVNNESFGADTIRLKENNLRINFEDTSTSAGFASNDWRIIANDQPSGGANKFAIEDSTAARNPMTIEAGAPANSLYVDSSGDVGIQQSAPGLDLHITTSDTPAMRYEQTNAGGFTAQTWDIGANEANFFVRDLTGGSRLSFRIRPGAPTSSVDIAADGDVGIGTASPEAKLHVFGGSTADTFVGIGPDPNGDNTTPESSLNLGLAAFSFGRAAGFMNVRPDASATAPNPSLRFATANTVRLIIDNEGFLGIGTTANPDAPIHYTNGATQARLTAAGVWTDASSRKAKENIAELDAATAIQTLEDLKPVTYNYKVLPADGKVGFIAEDVPEIVATPEREGLSALDIVAVVTKVVQEQQKTIEQLNERIAQLESGKTQQ